MPSEVGLTQLLIEIVVDANKRARFSNDRAKLLDEFVLAPATRSALLDAENQRTALDKLIDNQQTAGGTVTALEKLVNLAVDDMQRRRSLGGRARRKTPKPRRRK